MRAMIKKTVSMTMGLVLAIGMAIGSMPAQRALAAQDTVPVYIEDNWAYRYANDGFEARYDTTVYTGVGGGIVYLRLPLASTCVVPQSTLTYNYDNDMGSVTSSNPSSFAPTVETYLGNRYIRVSSIGGKIGSAPATITYSGYVYSTPSGVSGHEESKKPVRASFVIDYGEIGMDKTSLSFPYGSANTQTVTLIPQPSGAYFSDLTVRWCAENGDTEYTPNGAYLSYNPNTRVVSVGTDGTTPAGRYYIIAEDKRGLTSYTLPINMGKSRIDDIRSSVKVPAYYTQNDEYIIPLPALPGNMTYSNYDVTSISTVHTGGGSNIISRVGDFVQTNYGWGKKVTLNPTAPGATAGGVDTITMTISNDSYEPFKVIISVEAEKIDLTKDLIKEVFFTSKSLTSIDHARTMFVNGILDMDVFSGDSGAYSAMQNAISRNTPTMSFVSKATPGISYTNYLDAINGANPTGSSPVVYDITWTNATSIIEAFKSSSIYGVAGATYADKYNLPVSFNSKLQVYRDPGLYIYSDIPSAMANKMVYTNDQDRSVSYPVEAYSTEGYAVNYKWFVNNSEVSDITGRYSGTKSSEMTIIDASLLGVGTHTIQCQANCYDSSGQSMYNTVGSSLVYLYVVNGSSPLNNISLSGDKTVNVSATFNGEAAVIGAITKETINEIVTSVQASSNKEITLDISKAGRTITSAEFTKDSLSNISATLSASTNNKSAFKVIFSGSSISLDAVALSSIVNQSANNNISLGLVSKDKSALNASQQSAISSMDVVSIFDAYIQIGSNRISTFGGGKAEIELTNMTLPAGNSRDYYHIFYLSSSGSADRMGTKFVNSTVSVTLQHFSEYALVYDKTKTNDNVPEEPAKPVYRMYNSKTGEHLYTTDANEVTSLTALGWKGEPSPGDSADKTGVPVYRLYNTVTGEHLYTSDEYECKTLTALTWEYDYNAKPMFYGTKDKTGKGVYRLYDKTKPAVAQHHYTSDTNEIRELTTNYRFEYDNNAKPLYYLK